MSLSTVISLYERIFIAMANATIPHLGTSLPFDILVFLTVDHLEAWIESDDRPLIRIVCFHPDHISI